MSNSGFHRIWLTLKQPNYCRYIIGNGLSLTGTWMQRIAVGWLTWELTHSPTWLGLVAMADFFPVVLMGPLGGALADRFNRIRVMVAAQIVASIIAIILFILANNGALTEWHLISLTVISGAAVGLNQASRMTLAPSLVPRDMLTTAIAINSMVFNSARFIGPAASTLTISLWSINASFAINACSYIALIFALLSLKLPTNNSASHKSGNRSIWQDIREGISYTHQDQTIKLIMIMMTASALCLRPIIDLLPGLTADLFLKGVDGFATLTASMGIGAMLGGFWMAKRGDIIDLSNIALLGTLVIVFANLAIIITASFIVAIPLIALIGAGMVVSGIGMQSTLQLITPSEIRGRVLSLYGIIHIGGAGLGAFLLGLIAEELGLKTPIIGGALCGLVIWWQIWNHRTHITSSLIRVNKNAPPQNKKLNSR
jgi:MFS family permease